MSKTLTVSHLGGRSLAVAKQNLWNRMKGDAAVTVRVAAMSTPDASVPAGVNWACSCGASSPDGARSCHTLNALGEAVVWLHTTKQGGAYLARMKKEVGA